MKFLKKLGSRSVFIILLVTGVLMLFVTVGERYQLKIIQNTVQYITFPIQKAFNVVGDGVGNITARFQNMSDLLESQEELKEQVNKLSYDNGILEKYKIENEKLRQLLQLSEKYKEYPTEGANVIGKDPSNWYKIFTIDKGEGAGFAKYDTILAEGGLVGHIVESTPLSSKILSIIDDRSAVSSTVLRTGDIGILKGDIELMEKGLCKLQIDIQSEVIKGDQIVTSHLSDIHPPGITIGVVEDIIIAQNGLTQYAYVRPVVDFKHIEQVLVLKDKTDSLMKVQE